MNEVSIDVMNKEVTKWLRYMGRLNKQSISLIQPDPKPIPKGAKSEASQIMKYQGLM